MRGIGRTGRLVTSAALILFLAFVSLASGPETEIKVLATGLAAGILLDATIIRALLVPAVVSLFGRWNWWLPRMPARLLRVQPSPLPRLAAAGGVVMAAVTPSPLARPSSALVRGASRRARALQAPCRRPASSAASGVLSSTRRMLAATDRE